MRDTKQTKFGMGSNHPDGTIDGGVTNVDANRMTMQGSDAALNQMNSTAQSGKKAKKSKPAYL